MMSTQINIKPGDKIKLHSYKKAVKIGEDYIKSYMKSEELFSYLTDDDKLQYLPKEVFGRTYVVRGVEVYSNEEDLDNNIKKEEIIYRIRTKDDFDWYVSEMFVKDKIIKLN